jgi:hypothetical protein
VVKKKYLEVFEGWVVPILPNLLFDPIKLKWFCLDVKFVVFMSSMNRPNPRLIWVGMLNITFLKISKKILLNGIVFHEDIKI